MRFDVFLCVLVTAVATAAGDHSSIATEKSINDNEFGKIFNAWPATDGYFPHVVHIRSADYCAGSIITPSWVLTVAQCIFGNNTADVYIGSVDKNNPRIFTISRDLRSHPQYNPTNHHHNIGLVNLHINLIFDNIIAPIAIPRQSQAFEQFGVGSEAFLTGWGHTSISSHFPNILQYGLVMVVDNDRCRTYNNPSWVIDSVTCAEILPWAPVGPCHGDIGGSLTAYAVADQVNILLGLTSFFRGCSFYPAGYIRPQYYWSWINQNTGLPIRP